MDEPLPPADSGGYTGAPQMKRRFRAFLPVVVDVETGGFNCAKDALLEIAAVLIEFGPDGRLHRGETHSYHVRPFEGCEPRSRLAGGERHRSVASAASGVAGKGRARAHLHRGAQCHEGAGLPARRAGRPQRRLRSRVSQCRRGARRNQAQPVSSLLVLRHRNAGRRRVRPDRAGQGRAGLRHRLGFERRALRALRRGTHRGRVLRSVQRARWRVAQGRRARPEHVGRRPGAPEEG